jgi:predicted acyltransferase
MFQLGSLLWGPVSFKLYRGLGVLQFVATLPCFSVAALLVKAKACCVIVLLSTETIGGDNWLYVCFIVSPANCGGQSGSLASIDAIDCIQLDCVAVLVDGGV